MALCEVMPRLSMCAGLHGWTNMCCVICWIVAEVTADSGSMYVQDWLLVGQLCKLEQPQQALCAGMNLQRWALDLHTSPHVYMERTAGAPAGCLYLDMRMLL
jgi:hypothetical protein